MSQPVVLITGGARRIGAAIAKTLHSSGFRILIHCHQSQHEAQKLCDYLNQQRKESAGVLIADLNEQSQIDALSQQAIDYFGQLDALINNASSFYPTPIGITSIEQWDNLFGSNAKAPFFLSQSLTPELRKQHGCIINIADIHADKPLAEHTVYCMAKAANVMLTKSLAKELAPEVRVNGIAPGAILWPESELDAQSKHNILAKIPLKRTGQADTIASTVRFLLVENDYITGQIISVDGGRSLN
jgi:pteridine reductase